MRIGSSRLVVLAAALAAACGGGASAVGPGPAPTPIPTPPAPEPPPGAAEDVAGPVAFVDVTVVPMDAERLVPHQTVRVEAGRIVEIGDASRVRLPAGTHVVDGRDRFLMPGLGDMHTHVATETSTEAGPGQLLLYVASGVTTLLNQGDFGEPLPAWAARIRDGELLGPNLYTARYARGTGDGNPSNVWVTSPEGARAYVREAADLGYDFMKIYNFTGAAELSALFDEVDRVGLPVIGHLPQTVPPQAVFDAGLALVAHAGFGAYLSTSFGGGIRPDRVPAAIEATRAARAWVTPTLAVEEIVAGVWGGNQAAYENLFRQDGIRYVDPSTRARWETKVVRQRLYNPNGSFPGQRDAVLAFIKSYTRAFHDAGIPLMLGSDSPPVLLVPGRSIHNELRVYAEIGLSPYQVLVMGTRNPGLFVARHVPGAEPFGLVAEGYRADLVLLEANPLDDVAHLRQQAGVMVRGRWLSARRLHDLLERLAATF